MFVSIVFLKGEGGGGCKLLPGPYCGGHGLLSCLQMRNYGAACLPKNRTLGGWLNPIQREYFYRSNIYLLLLPPQPE